MSEQYNPYNLPGQEGYQWKAPPGYTPVSGLEQLLAQGLAYGGPGQQYQQGTQGLLQALQGGGFTEVSKHLGKLGEFAMGGKRMGDAYEKAATKQLQQTGQAAFRGIQSQMGGQGALGSTAHLGGLSDLGAKYAGERANIGATAAQMGEQAMLGRLGAGISGLSQLGQLRSYEQMNQMQGMSDLARLGLQEQGMGYQQNLGALAALQQQRMEPSQWGYDIWTANQRAPKGGGFGQVLGGLAQAAAPWFMPVGGGGGGYGGGGGSYMPQGAYSVYPGGK